MSCRINTNRVPLTHTESPSVLDMRPQHTLPFIGVVIPVLSVGIEAAIRAFFLYNKRARFIIGEGQMNFLRQRLGFIYPPHTSVLLFFRAFGPIVTILGVYFEKDTNRTGLSFHGNKRFFCASRGLGASGS